MNPNQQQLLTGLGLSLLLLIIIIGLIVFARSKWAVQKKFIGAVVFLLGFIFLWGIWVNLSPYFSHNFVLGEVENTNCSNNTRGYFSRVYPDCNYEITYVLDNKDQTTKINSMSSAIELSQGQQVEVYYKKGSPDIGVSKEGDNKSFVSYLSSHWRLVVFLLLGLMFFYTGFKLMGLISTGTDEVSKDKF